jgi:hypothetical protein
MGVSTLAQSVFTVAVVLKKVVVATSDILIKYFKEP